MLFKYEIEMKKQITPQDIQSTFFIRQSNKKNEKEREREKLSFFVN